LNKETNERENLASEKESEHFPYLGCSNLGDQIGRLFAQWLIVSFGQFLENKTSSPNFGAILFNG
jgi:hypothetical protein